MSDYYNILTNLGRSKITDLITSDAALENIQIAFGDGNGSVPTPNPARTALVNEVHRRPADKLEHHPTLTNNIIVDVVIPASVGSFWIREFGIYFDGVLICHGSLPPSYKEASEDGVNTYRLKPYINVESDRLKVVEIEGNLINATESWTQENFINRGEIADNLTTDDATKVASAKQVKILNDDKANKTTTLTAGNGLSGGGTLEINRTLTLGTPSKITGSTTNSVTATSHTHEIDNASTSVAGVVKLNNTLTSTSTTEALTAAQGKVLNDQAYCVNQTWKDVKSNRILGATYQNPSSKPITLFIRMSGQDSGIKLTENDFIFPNLTDTYAGSTHGQFVTIGPFSSYKIEKGSAFANTLLDWFERS